VAELREHIFRDCLDAAEVDVDELRRIVWAHGVPDCSWARPAAWKLLTGYIPPDRVDWEPVLATKRAAYWQIVAEHTVDPSVSSPAGDHPLCVDTGSRWAEYFRDRDLREVIDKDVVRTHADLHRFAPLRDALRRILFVYSKTDGAAACGGYRQGMNELAAPLLLCFADAPFADLSDAEADAYFCFEVIMSDMASLYVAKASETIGVGRHLQELKALLCIKDPRLEAHLSQLEIDPRFYALRWGRLWLAREFTLPDLFRIWDSLFATEIRLPWLRYVCVAMLIRIREELLSTDFAGCMKLLLHYPPCDISELLQIADRLRTANVTIVRSVQRRVMQS
jgi:TBC1 domain family member 13